MGTHISVLLPAERAAEGLKVVRSLFAEWEETLSRFLPNSELSQVNARAGKRTAVSELLWRVLTAALEAAQATDGLYDPTMLHQLVSAGYDRSFEDLPPARPAPTSAAIPGGGWRSI